jgi:Zn-dependent protease
MEPEKLLIKAALVLIPMLLSLTVHEYAHARIAFALGDNTAYRMGRMNLNPISHIDIFGTIILPLICIISGGFFFGWAKPVPVNPVNFRRDIRMKTGMLITALAGPASNLLFAVVLGILIKIINTFDVQNEAISLLVEHTFMINVVLAIFNLIPVPPLDGSKILVGLLPDRASGLLYFLEKNPIFVIIAFAILITQAGRILSIPVELVSRLILMITGN